MCLLPFLLTDMREYVKYNMIFDLLVTCVEVKEEKFRLIKLQNKNKSLKMMF